MAKQVIRTFTAGVRNHRQVCGDLDSLGFAASKLWNVGRWTVARIWDETGTIPADGPLKAYLKSHERYADLNAQSSQKVLEELSEAFDSWYGHRRNGNKNANPPGYRKHGDEHPRSTVTFKADGFTHDATNNRVRLSKGRNLKEHRSDFILCKYDAGPNVTVENVQQVRAVYERGEWRLHFICRVEVAEAESPGDGTAGIDLGICNFAAVSFGDESLLYPGGALKEDNYYFSKERAKTDDSASREAQRLDRKRSERQTHFLHALSKDIVEECAARGVGHVAVGDLGGIREDGETGDARSWGTHGNLDLHGWAFDRFASMLEYKGEQHGIDVGRVSERGTSKTCCVCGAEDDRQRVERGLYVCEACDDAYNADCNGAENIRKQVPPSPSDSASEDRSTGWLAQPAVRLFDRSGAFAPQEQVVDREP
ncbi:RNA-guided endonuclease TnpB family protein [Halarchaeum salinum]|uniref:RNA-guided endonuclease TnpB family protein n=1 Tax=Halarchaeum salinum TaxID=489912 RepID=A0AAV3S5C3_9EURY